MLTHHLLSKSYKLHCPLAPGLPHPLAAPVQQIPSVNMVPTPKPTATVQQPAIPNLDATPLARPHPPATPIQQTPSVNMAPAPELTETVQQPAIPNLNATPSARPHPLVAPVQQMPPACPTAQKRPVPRASDRGSSTTTTQLPDPFSGELSPVASPQVSPAPKRPKKGSRPALKQSQVTEGTRKSSRKK